MGLTVAVVVTTFRRPALLQQLLHSVAASTLEPTEVIVVDNDPEGSLSGGDLPAPCQVIHGGFGLNLSAARNLGWRAAGADLIMFIDDDNVIDMASLALLTRHFETDEQLGLSAPVIWADTGRTVWCGGINRSRWTGQTRFLFRGADSVPVDATWPTVDMPDAFMIRRTALKEVDGFDEQNFPFHYQEADLCARLRERDWKLEVNGGAAVRHFGFAGSRPGEEYLRALKLSGRERVAGMAASRGLFYCRHSRGLSRAAVLSSSPLWLLLVCVSVFACAAPVTVKLRTVRALLAGTLRGYRACASRW